MKNLFSASKSNHYMANNFSRIKYKFKFKFKSSIKERQIACRHGDEHNYNLHPSFPPSLFESTFHHELKSDFPPLVTAKHSLSLIGPRVVVLPVVVLENYVVSYGLTIRQRKKEGK